MPDAWRMPHAHPNLGGARVLTPADPAFHHYGHPAVWGALAGAGHNPLRDHEFDDRAEVDRYGWDQAEAAHPGYVKAFHDAYGRYVDKSHPILSVPTHLVGQVLRDGRMKSQFEAVKTKGVYDPAGRAEVEQHMFGYHPTDTAPHARPIYGSLSVHPYTDAGTAGYGSTTFVLHKPAVWHRTTFSGDDSWARWGRVQPVPVSDYAADPHRFRHAVPVDHMGFGGYDRAFDTTADYQAQKMEERDPVERAATFWHGGDREWRAHAYPEAQYHGGVAMHDVRFAILRSPDREGRAHPTRMGPLAQAASEQLSEANIPWVHTVGWRKPRPDDHSFMPAHNDLRLPPAFPDTGHTASAVHHADDDGFDTAFTTEAWHTANLLTDLGGPPVVDPHVHWERPGGWLLTYPGTGEGDHTLARAVDPEWGLSSPAALGSFLARGYWKQLDQPLASRDVLHVYRRSEA